MLTNRRASWISLLALGLACVGCEQPSGDRATPAESAAPVGTPAPAADSRADAGETNKPDNAAAAPGKTEKDVATAAKGSKVQLEPVTYDEYLKRIAANKTKYTLVDAWATWCAPCKENFPHVVQMNKKYGDKGLTVISLSLDQPDDAKQVAEAKKFLEDSGATFTNFLLNEEAGAAFDKLNVNGVPAVFVYDSSGKEVRRYTGDDTKNQFTYDEVEKDIVALLEGKTLPERKRKDEGEEKAAKQ